MIDDVRPHPRDRAGDRPRDTRGDARPADVARHAALTLGYPGEDGSDQDPPLPAVLARIEYGGQHALADTPGHLKVGLRPPGAGGQTEIWRVERILERAWCDDIGVVVSPELMFAHCLVAETDPDALADITRAVYSRLLDRCHRHGYPHPIRIWNLIQSIHGASAGLERYRAFSLGRARAFAAAGLAEPDIPAASAVGAAAPGLLVYLLAARRPGTGIENPRQTPAYRYPTRYGPRPPQFARATRADALTGRPLFISGTASIQGHASLHPGDLGRQLAETLCNLESLLLAAGETPGRRPDWLKVYLRDPGDMARVAPTLRAWTGPGTSLLYLQADICRRELEIEIEGLLLP